MDNLEEVGQIVHLTWRVERHGTVTELHDGEKLKYRVDVWDHGRMPFLTKWFNDPVAASDFIEKMKLAGEAEHN